MWSNTPEILGLSAMPLKSSQFNDLLIPTAHLGIGRHYVAVTKGSRYASG